MMFTKEQLEDLITYCGGTKIKPWKNNWVNFTCTMHHEANPSCGICYDYDDDGLHRQLVSCFSCGRKGDIAYFVMQSLPDRFRSRKFTIEWLERRYGVKHKDHGSFDLSRGIRRYGEMRAEKEAVHLPNSELAKYHCGEKTYKYFFSRGYTWDDVDKYEIGMDELSKTVVFPVKDLDGNLNGFIGRYISSDRPKNERYKIYSFERGQTLYPLNHFMPDSYTVILCEGMFDALRLHKYGFTNALAIMGAGFTTKQREILCELGTKHVITAFDSDNGGEKARERVTRMLKGLMSVKHCESVADKKDPDEWSEQEATEAISSAGSSPKVRRVGIC